MRTVSIYEARNNLSDYVKMAEEGKPIILKRYNKPVAVIISYEDFTVEDTQEKSWLMQWREKHASELNDKGIPIPSKKRLNYNKEIFED